MDGRTSRIGTEVRRHVPLLLSHTPDNIGVAAGQDVDLVLAGHNHGARSACR
ncbi:MAG: hypothetical protein Ct9H300mP1_07680 [Planctomycetaceae bacterium]|nr:MAG: hypothetical protein Ct9H300mP1_07680 [Planctomycetaceae bacterium]